MLRRTLTILSVCLIFSLFLANCAQDKLEPIIVTREVITTRIVRVPATPQVIEVCHLLGCFDQLTITLNGQVKDDFIVEVQQFSEPEVVLHCFPLRESGGAIFGKHDYLNLNNPEDLEEIREHSPAVNYCGSTVTGEARLSYLRDGYLDEVVVFCSDQLSEIVSINYSGCTRQEISLIGYTPEDVTISVYWGDNQKTVTVKPDYETRRPNGPNCEPECRAGQVSVQIP